MSVPAAVPILHLTEDADGISRFADAAAPLDPGTLAPTAPLMPIFATEAATGLLYLIPPAGWGGAQHSSCGGRWPSASRAGCVSRPATARCGSSEPARSGGWRMSGTGHTATVLGDQDVRLAIVQP